MIIHPIVPQDTLQNATPAPYDSIQASTSVPVREPDGLERVMLAEDKLFVVLAVVLIIWSGIVFFIWRTDRRLRNLERTVRSGIPEETV